MNLKFNTKYRQEQLTEICEIGLIILPRIFHQILSKKGTSIGYLHLVIVIHKKCFDINVLIILLKNEPGVMLHIHIHYSQIVIQVDVNTFHIYVISTTYTNPYFSFLTFSGKNFNNGWIFTIKVTKKLPNVES